MLKVPKIQKSELSKWSEGQFLGLRNDQNRFHAKFEWQNPEISIICMYSQFRLPRSVCLLKYKYYLQLPYRWLGIDQILSRTKLGNIGALSPQDRSSQYIRRGKDASWKGTYDAVIVWTTCLLPIGTFPISTLRPLLFRLVTGFVLVSPKLRK